ncbi:hypothetical protein [Streptomyces sp. NPDC056672]
MYRRICGTGASGIPPSKVGDSELTLDWNNDGKSAPEPQLPRLF